VTGRGGWDVLSRPLAHYLTLGHLDSPVDDDVKVDTKFDVSVDSLTVTETIPAHIAPTDIILTGCLVFFIGHEPVASPKDRLISKDATHGFSVVSSYFMDGTRPLRVVHGIRTIFPLLPRVTKGVRRRDSDAGRCLIIVAGFAVEVTTQPSDITLPFRLYLYVHVGCTVPHHSQTDGGCHHDEETNLVDHYIFIVVFAPEDPGPVELFAVSQDLLVLEQLDNLPVDVDDYGFSARDTGTSTRYVLHGYTPAI